MRKYFKTDRQSPKKKIQNLENSFKGRVNGSYNECYKKITWKGTDLVLLARFEKERERERERERESLLAQFQVKVSIYFFSV